MSLNLTEKKAVVAEVSAQVAQAQAIVLAEYRGMGVADMTILRAEARKSGVYLRVLKNTLVRRAVEGTAFSGLSAEMVGPLVFGISTDPVALAKLFMTFAAATGSVEIPNTNGPTISVLKPENAVPSTARRTSVFFNTRR